MFHFSIFHVSTYGVEMIVRSGDIISWKIWQPFVRLFRHCVGVSRDGGYVQGFIKVFFPRVSHCRKGKGTVEKGFRNGRLEGRPSSVNLRRFESPWGELLREDGLWEGGVAR
jgi:hypothetical protein